MMRFLKQSVIGILLFVTGLWAADVNVYISDSGADNVVVYVESTVDIGGFQFLLNDDPNVFDVATASGGMAQDAGFMLSTNANGLVLGFSLTGSTIPAGNGILTVVGLSNITGDYAQLTMDGLIFSDPSGNGLDVAFTQTGGFYEWGEAPLVDMAHLTVSEGTAEAGTTGTVAVSLENTMDVGGFQFTLVDSPDLVTLLSAEATDRTAGFMVSTNESGLVLGFSLTGGIVAAGEGPIVVLTFQAGSAGGVADLAFTDVILSDPSGAPITATWDDGTFTVTGGATPDPAVTIVSPQDGSTIYGTDINVVVAGENMLEGDHFHAYIDGNLVGPQYSSEFTLTDVPFGVHELTVVVTDANHNEYQNPEATDTVSFENMDSPPVDVTTLYLGTGNVAAGGTVDIPLSLTNPEVVIAGFQLQLVDFPNYLDVTDVATTDRTDGFMISFNEQEDGTVIIVGFDINAVGIALGSGPILTVTYQSTGIYTADIELSFSTAGTILSDLSGVAVDYDAENGTVHVEGEQPPPIFSPENLTAMGGFGMVNLAWTHPEPWDVVGYYIFRDGTMVGESQITNYADTGLDMGVEYCYTVIAYNDFAQSEPSAEVCATTLEQYFEEPANLVAEENGLEINLTWDIPPGQIGIGDSCEGCGDSSCVYDCEMQCVSENTVNAWLGDGWCDDGTYGIYLYCEEYNWDYGDCDGDNSNQDPNGKEMYAVTTPRLELLGYEIYRNNQLLDYTEDTEYTDTSDLWYLETYCYNVTAVYDEGTSGFSNTSCAEPQLGEPSGLSAMGTGDYITLEWSPHPDNAQDGFNVYRDGTFIGFTADPLYEDHDTVHDVEYCYTVTAFYEGIGESPATNEVCTMWSLYPPSHISAYGGDGYVDLTWEEPTGGEEVYLQYDDGLLANAFYFYDTYEDGYAHGMKFDVGVEFDVLAASIYILSEGDEYYPWPNSTHGPVRVMIFDDNNGTPGALLYDEEAVAEDGWATVYPNLTGLSGAFYVIASHTENWSTGGDPEGFGIDGAVDYPNNMYTYYEGAWATGDYLGYGGDYMMSTLINAYGTVLPLSYGDTPPAYPQPDMAAVANSVHDGSLSATGQPVTPPAYNIPAQSRTLESYDIYRDGDFVVNVPADVFTYRDEPLANMIEYCYTMVGVYTEGESEASDPVCATPVPGYSPTELAATDSGGGTIHLEWMEPAPFENDVLDYQIYRDGEHIGVSNTTSYDDMGVAAGVVYCYTVTARYVSGESFPSNEDCAVYVLNPPVGVTAEGMNDEHGVLVSWFSPEDAYSLDIEILTDNYPGETSWELADANGNIIESLMQGSLTDPGVVYNWSLVITPGTYTFTIFDSFGDGICCGYGEGYYSLMLNGGLIATGGEFGQSESVTFNTEDYLVTVSQTEYVEPVPFEKGMELTAGDVAGLSISEPVIISTRELTIPSRQLLGYNVYRDGSWLVEVGMETTEYLDTATEHDVIYCYVVRGIYEDGESIPSNEACAQWILPPVTGLVAMGTEGTVELSWNAADSAELLSYEIYRDGELFGTTTDTFYSDMTAEHDVLYCYTVYAVYELGNSAPSNEACAMWMILPPAALTADAGDEMVHLEWQEGVSAPCADVIIPALPFNDINSNVGLTDDWTVQGSQGADIAYGLVLAQASFITVDLCSENTDYDSKLEIFTADDECVETTTGFYDDDGPSCPESPATFAPSLIENAYLEAGSYYIVVDGFGGGEGNFEINVWQSEGVECAVDPPYDDECYYYVIGVDPFCCNTDWDGLCEDEYQACLGGDEMSEEDIQARFDRTVLEDIQYEAGKTGTEITLEDWNSAPYQGMDQNAGSSQRELTAYNIYRDGSFLTSVDAGVFEYDDLGLNNFTQYCYNVTAVYDEGESPESNEACAEPIPGIAPTALVATPVTDHIELTWNAGGDNLLNYIIYRDGAELATTQDTFYSDMTAEHDISYCYQVTAMYPNGESYPSNEFCAMWELGSVFAWIETEGNGFLELQWSDPGMSGGGGDTIDDPFFIPSIPFEEAGTTIGFTDDYDEECPYSGSTSPDVVYLWSAQPGQYYLSICDSDYDTKIYIYDENQNLVDCVDDSCNDPAGNPWRSDMNVSVTSAGFYYIVIDGYGGASGNYNFSISEGFVYTGDAENQPLKDDIVPDVVIGDDEGVVPPAPQTVNRELIGFEIFRDGDNVYTAAPDERSFIDLGLENGTTYCYTVLPVYDEGPAQQSNEACGAPDAGPMCPPENFDVETVPGLPYAHLTWDTPGDCDDGGGGGGGDNPGDACFDCGGDSCIIDCVGECVDEATAYSWIGDGWCDDGTYGINLLCEEFQFDLGDCDGDAGNMDEPKEAWAAPENVERLSGYNIYRDNVLVDSVGPEETEYDDSGVTFGQEHCWKVKAIYDEGESNPTETICETVVDPGLISQLYFEAGTLEAGAEASFNITLDNREDVAGFQFTVSDTPDLLEMVAIETTDRTDDFEVQFNEQPDGSVIIVGFSLVAGVIEVGDGPILNVTYTTQGNIMNETDVAIDFSNIYLGDPDGIIVVTLGNSSTITVVPAGASELFVGDGSANLGEEGSFDISLTNELQIAGFQFDLSFDPDIAELVEVLPTDRTPGWMISGGAVSGTIIGFSIDGTPIEPGEGPIVMVTVAGTDVGVASSCLSNIILSDMNGQQVPVSSQCGGFTVTDEPVVMPPVLTATGGDNQIDLEWTFEPPARDRETVNLSIASFENGQLAIYMQNSEDVAGFQFNLESDIAGYSLTGGSGGTADQYGFMVSTNTGGLVLGFSLTGAVIPAGEGVLLYADVSVTGDEGCFTIASPIISNAAGNLLDSNPGEPFCLGGNEVPGCTDPEALNYDPEATVDDGSCIYDIYGCTDPEALNYNPEATVDDGSCMYPYELTFNIYRDGDLYTSVVEMYNFTDANLDYSETHCYTVTAVLADGSETDHSNEECATTNPFVGLQHFTDLPENTGEHSLIVIQDIDLQPGDEIGLYDAQAIMNSGNCDNEIGELLVGAGVWTGEQLNISAVGSIDYCDFGGAQFPGYVNGNPIMYKVWSAADDMEYMASPTYIAGGGTWGELITVVSLEVQYAVTQSIDLDPFMNNMLSFNVIPEDPAVTTIFGDAAFMVWDDQGSYFVPNFGINSIVDVNYLEGYGVFIDGTDPVVLTATGMQADPATSFTIEPFMNNMIPFLPQDAMSAFDALGSYDESLLVVTNDSGEFYVPEFGVFTLTTMEPGEGYKVFLSVPDAVEFSYPAAALASQVVNEWDALKPEMVTNHYDVVRTGIVHPIIITDIRGNVQEGDELAVYANGELVGATRIADLSRPIPVAAWGGSDQFGIQLSGYSVGDEIEIRLWSQTENRELRVTSELDGSYYGLTPLTTGSITVYNDDAVPTQFTLDQNYPNPFNPNTTIEFSVPADSRMTIVIYDIMGRMVKTLLDNKEVTGGYHTIVWDGTDMNGNLVSAGLYIYTMQGEGISLTRKMVMMK